MPRVNNRFNWIDDAVSKIEKKGTKGVFRAKARSAGWGNTCQYAKHVMENKPRFSEKTVKQANFANNMCRFTH